MHADEAFAAESTALDRNGKSKRTTLKQEAVEWLEQTLTQEQRAVTEIVEKGDQSGFDRRTLQRAFKEMGGVPHKEGFDGGWSWSLPKVDADIKLTMTA